MTKHPAMLKKYDHARQPEVVSFFPLKIHYLPNGLSLHHDIEKSPFLGKTFCCKKSWGSHAGEKPADGLSGEQLSQPTLRPTKHKRREREKLHKQHRHQKAQQILFVGNAN